MIRLISGQPVCISCDFNHTIKLTPTQMRELEKGGKVVIEFN